MTIGFRESLKQFLHSAPARKKRAFHLTIPDRSRLRTRRLQAPTDLIVIAGRLGSSDKSSKAPSEQGALNQGLDSLRFFLAFRLSPIDPTSRVVELIVLSYEAHFEVNVFEF